MPGGYNDEETFCDSGLVISLPAGKTYSHAPTTRRDVTDYKRAGMKVLLNSGGATPSNLSGTDRTLFWKHNNLEAFRPNKPFNQWDEPECRDFVYWLYDNLKPFGFVCHEAQENEGPWKFQIDYAPSQCVWVEKYWGELMGIHPEIQYAGAYSGVAYIYPTAGFDNATESLIRNAFASGANAKQYLQNNEFFTDRYFSSGIHQYRMPLHNSYIHHLDPVHVKSETVAELELMRLALPTVGRNPDEACVFVWTRCEAGISPYLESYYKRIAEGSDAIMAGIRFPGFDLMAQIEICRNGISRANHVVNWNNPYHFGRDKTLIAAEESPFKRLLGNLPAGYRRATGGPDANYVAAPLRPNQTNPEAVFPPFPEGGMDAGPAGAWLTSQAIAFCNAPSLPAKWRSNGVGSFTDPNSAQYWPDVFYGEQKYVQQRALSNKRVVNIYAHTTGEVEVDMNGATRTFPHYAGIPMQYTGTI